MSSRIIEPALLLKLFGIVSITNAYEEHIQVYLIFNLRGHYSLHGMWWVCVVPMTSNQIRLPVIASGVRRVAFQKWRSLLWIGVYLSSLKLKFESRRFSWGRNAVFLSKSWKVFLLLLWQEDDVIKEVQSWNSLQLSHLYILGGTVSRHLSSRALSFPTRLSVYSFKGSITVVIGYSSGTSPLLNIQLATRIKIIIHHSKSFSNVNSAVILVSTSFNWYSAIYVYEQFKYYAMLQL